jgi:hypothetical protein
VGSDPDDGDDGASTVTGIDIEVYAGNGAHRRTAPPFVLALDTPGALLKSP